MPQTGLEWGMEGVGTPPGTPSDLRPSPWGVPGPLQRGSRGCPRRLSGGVPDGSPKGFQTNTLAERLDKFQLVDWLMDELEHGMRQQQQLEGGAC